ncbi:MAG: hypothetical protein IPN03_06550 [Holophagales bacterium]|nr:hypothetical protein [Holophagales bacterium]
MTLIPLSPIDHVFTGRGAYPIEFAFAYAGAMDAGRLEQSLHRALEAFPPVSSRFVRVAGNALAFEPYEGGCAFRVAESATGFAETERRTVFLDPVDGREGEPLARVLLTRTPNGCVLGFSLSHAVADGYSYFHFLTSWARLFRGEPFPPPSHAREALVPAVDGSGTVTDPPRRGRAVPGRTPHRGGSGPHPPAPPRPLPGGARRDAPGGPGGEPGPPLAQRHGGGVALEEVPRGVGR